MENLINKDYVVNVMMNLNDELETRFEDIKEYAENAQENDPTFQAWVFGNPGNIGDWGTGMTKEQKKAYSEFMNCL